MKPFCAYGHLYFSTKKLYRKQIKISKLEYNISLLEELQQLSNEPKKFWSHLKKVCQKDPLSLCDNVSNDSWMSHFTELNKKDPSNEFPDSFSVKQVIKDTHLSLKRDNTLQISRFTIYNTRDYLRYKATKKWKVDRH